MKDISVLEPMLQQWVTDKKILVVGTGTIGCEVLKCLVLSGFTDISIVRDIKTSQIIIIYILLEQVIFSFVVD